MVKLLQKIIILYASKGRAIIYKLPVGNVKTP